MTFHFKTLIDPKPSSIRFDKIDGFVRIYDGTGYWTLLGSGKYEAIYDRIRCLISLTSGMTYIFYTKLILMIICQ